MFKSNQGQGSLGAAAAVMMSVVVYCMIAAFVAAPSKTRIVHSSFLAEEHDANRAVKFSSHFTLNEVYPNR